MQDGSKRYRLPRTVTPSRYDLELEPDLEDSTFSGSEDVAVRVHQTVEDIVLNAADLEVLSGWIADGEGRRAEVAGVRLDPEAERVHLSFSESVGAGDWTLHLEFRGQLNANLQGFYRSTYTDDDGLTHVVAATHFEATDARRAFPCWDEPDLKAAFGVTLVVDDGLTALSNGPETTRERAANGRIRVRFADTMVMSTYLVAFVVGRLDLSDPVDAAGVPLGVAHVPGKGHLASFALDIGAFSMRFFTDYYDIPYPDRKLDFVALPDFAAGAMENLGLVTYRESSLLIDPATATQQELQNVADTVAHEVAHMWFGDLVTMQWWNGIWLNEAFATFMELLVVDEYRPDWQRWTRFARTCSGALEVDALENTRSIEYPVRSPLDANGMFDVLTYTKGAAILRMLQRYLGAERFREGIRQYLAKHAHGNTETSDLWDAVEAATGEPVRRIMDSWIWQGGYPQLSVRTEDDAVRITQERFTYSGRADGTRWVVPLVVRGSPNGDASEMPVLVEGDGATIPSAAGYGPIVANAGGGTFVRIRYGEDLMEGLSVRLEELHPIERYALVDDLWAAALAGDTGLTAFCRFLRRLHGEGELAVWQAALNGLGWCDRFLEGDVRERFRAFVRDLVGPALERLGWRPASEEPDLTRELRGLLARAMAVLGDDPDARSRARGLVEAALAGESVDPALASAAVRAVAASGTGADYERFLAASEAASTPQERLRYLFALADFPDPDLIDRTLRLAMGDEVRTQDAPFLLAAVMANRDHGERAWRFVKEHWDEVNRRFASANIIRMVDGVRFLTTPEQEADVHAFFEEYDVPQAAKTLQQTLERQRIGVAFRRRATQELGGLF